MFTKADYTEYFTSILNMEEVMLSSLQGFIKDVSDPAIHSILAEVEKDEIEHVQLAHELINLTGL